MTSVVRYARPSWCCSEVLEGPDSPDDDLSFDPWRFFLEHQPLGSIQWVRKSVYDDSAQDRHRLNDRPVRERRASGATRLIAGLNDGQRPTLVGAGRCAWRRLVEAPGQGLSGWW